MAKDKNLATDLRLWGSEEKNRVGSALLNQGQVGISLNLMSRDVYKRGRSRSLDKRRKRVSRSRSRSPLPSRSRSRSRSHSRGRWPWCDRRHRDDFRRQNRNRTSPPRRPSRYSRRSRSPRYDSVSPGSSRGSDSPEDRKNGKKTSDKQPKDEESLLMSCMGFSEFSTTKNKPHDETDAYGVAKKSKRRYRQYMNRKGGFNRPLDAVY